MSRLTLVFALLSVFIVGSHAALTWSAELNKAESIIASNGQFSLFSKFSALINSNIGFSNGSKVTILAPTDAAVSPQLLALTLKYSSQAGRILKYHFIKGVYTYDQLVKSFVMNHKFATLDGASFLVKTSKVGAYPVTLRAQYPSPSKGRVWVWLRNLYVGNYIAVHGVETLFIPPEVYKP